MALIHIEENEIRPYKKEKKSWNLGQQGWIYVSDISLYLLTCTTYIYTK
jgi:hypothetical protein